MIPSSFIILPSFPQTSSGKIDRQALSKLQRLPSPDRRYEPPQTETQCAVAKIWADVLKIDRIGLHESFFDLGGHSLLAAQLLARIESYFNRQLSLRALLETPTVAAIAAAIDAPDTSVHPITATSSATLRADAQLDNAIHPSPGPLPDEVKHIFLTGATGFLGAAMLAELLHVSSDVVIHCLVRADGIDHALKRLRSSLQSHCRSLDSVQSRVRPIVGDLAKPLLGLSPHDFAHLATTIDAIYHCGAAVSAIQPYPALRAPNVAGVTEILRLACQSRPRHLHYISTLAVWASPAYFDQSEILETSDPIYCEGLDGGYTQSKWVAEHLVLQARARGLPVSIYRPGLITGHSRTGLCKSDDLTLAAARLCIDLGILPTLDISLDLIPVDYTAAAIVHLSRQPTSAGRIFHLCNPHPISWTLFGQWLRRQGYNLTPVDPDQLATVTCAHDDPASIAALKMLVGSDRHAAPASRIDDHNTRTGLSGSPIQCPPVDDALLATYLAHFIRTGQIAPPA
jgi:thioester reductase-like protein